ncbi:MAG: DUF4870 domain-containing protein [Candidatus Pacebacteria bacterium]|nr:DUF4870 domain-containing protein [Candidatus Paceibacterota bacterium]
MAEEEKQKLKKGTGLPKNTTAALSYALGWATGILFLILEKDAYVRFHAMQSILVFGALTIIAIFPFLGWLLTPILGIVSFVLWLVLIYKAYQGEKFKLPVIGDFAEKQLGKIK